MTKEYIPQLTLDIVEPAATPLMQVQPPANGLSENNLTAAELQAIEEFADKIDITDSNVVMNYGVAAQKNVSAFSENALQQIRTKDLGDVGNALAGLVQELKSFDTSGKESKGLFGFFKKKKDALETMKLGYAKASDNVNEIVHTLEGHKLTLLRDMTNLDQMYELNVHYFKELTMYSLAGRKKLEQVRSTQLAELQATATATGKQEDAQAYNDLANLCTRFEKKLHDLELTRMISLQMGPQTRLLQNNNAQMIEKIDSSLLNTIPLWKSQMVLALGLDHARQATASQNAVNEMTNALLQQNADMLKMGTIETAKEAERSIVDIDTLRHTNQQLMETLDEVMKIQAEGAQKRHAAEAELAKIESELKQKLLELRDKN